MNFEEIVAKEIAARTEFPVEDPVEPTPDPVAEPVADPAEPVADPVAEPVATPDSSLNTDPINVEELRAQLREELAKEFESKKPTYANETVARLNELAASGIDIDSPEFWKWQYTDLEKYDTSNVSQALELRKLELEIENPTLNEKQISRLLKKSYPALFDETMTAEDTEYQEAMEDLSIDAIRSVTKLKKHKESVQLPKVDLQKKEQNEAAAKAAHEAFLKDVRTNVQSYAEEPIKLDKDLEIKYIPSDDVKKFIESSIVNNQTFFVDNYVKDNKVDYSRLRRDMARLFDFDNIIKTVYEQGISVGKEQVVDSLENSSTGITADKQQRARSLQDQVLEQFAIQNSRKR